MSTFVLLAVTDVRHRVESRLLAACDDWWQVPALVVAALLVAAAAVWIYRRDAVELRPTTAALLTTLRLAALAGVAAAVFDVERIVEHEIVLPSRVAVVVDTSASMSLAAADADDAPRSRRAAELLGADGLVAALRQRHEVDIWRFGAEVEPIARLPMTATDAAADGGWAERLGAEGVETRLAEGVVGPLADGPAGTLAGIVVLSDGGANAGADPATASAAARAAGVAVHAIGIGADKLPDDVRIADLIVPARVFPGDRFPVTAFLRAQGFAGRTVLVELVERAAEAADADEATGTVLDAIDVVLAADGELVPVRFDVPGIRTAGRRTLGVRLASPVERGGLVGRRAELEVVDRVTRVLLMASGPGREYQFLRNVLSRDRSFSVDVLLETAAPGSSQDARRVLDAFPATDEALADYDAVVAIDVDWRGVDPAGQARLERWVGREAGGLVLVAGPVFTQSWLDDPRSAGLRDLAPVEVRRSSALAVADRDLSSPQPLEFTREGRDAEFLWLAPTRGGSDAIWREFPGVHACFPVDGTKAGATEYLTLGRAGPLFLAGQYYGAGVVAWVGSGELWRLRSLDPAAHERLATQLLRHVSQGRLLRGARRAQLIVDRDRCPVGGEVTVRVVAADPGAVVRTPAARIAAPDGSTTPLRLEAEAARPGTLRGSFVAAREGGWLVEVDAVAGDERLTRRVEAHLPERELARPLLDRGTLAHLADATGGTVRFLADGGWTEADTAAVVAACPDRTRREYETGGTDAAFKRRLNAILLAGVAGCLGMEWLIRRIARLA
ncbi:MAG: hypothetical protein ACKO40_16490 [Planctomycetaceae bacterium]